MPAPPNQRRPSVYWLSCRPGYYHTLHGRRKQHGALKARRGVANQRFSVTPVWNHNNFSAVNGNGYYQSGHSNLGTLLLTCSTASAGDYAAATCSNNVLQGPNSLLYESAAYPAKYIGNLCTGWCTIR